MRIAIRWMHVVMHAASQKSPVLSVVRSVIHNEHREAKEGSLGSHIITIMADRR